MRPLVAVQHLRASSDTRRPRVSVLMIRGHARSVGNRSVDNRSDQSRWTGSSCRLSYSRCWGLYCSPMVPYCLNHSSLRLPLYPVTDDSHGVGDMAVACTALTACEARQTKAYPDLARTRLRLVRHSILPRWNLNIGFEKEERCNLWICGWQGIVAWQWEQ